MQRVCKGCETSFAELVTRHTERFFVLAYRTLRDKSDAEDIVQGAFLKLWQNPASWNADKSQFTTWFYRVVLNACHDFQRKHKRRELVATPVLETLTTPTESVEDALEAAQLLDQRQGWLSSALAGLSAAQLDAVNLVIYSGLPQQQAAAVMGISLKALESLLGRARKALSASIALQQQAATSATANFTLAINE